MAVDARYQSNQAANINTYSSIALLIGRRVGDPTVSHARLVG